MLSPPARSRRFESVCRIRRQRGSHPSPREVRRDGRRCRGERSVRRSGRRPVGASLAGLRAAEALRLAGFTGSLTLIGDEPYPPYDRPLEDGPDRMAAVEHTTLPQFVDIDAEWRLGVSAVALDLAVAASNSATAKRSSLTGC